MRYLIAFLVLFAVPAIGQTVRVTSGEHDGFTRLVFDYGQPVNWQVGRSLDGYEVHLTGIKPTYDLSNAFELIGKSRLAAIWAAPDTGNLQIGLACACHVIPFEFRPGIVVLDLKDGAPPSGSSFELGLNGEKPASLNTAAVRPRRRPDEKTALNDQVGEKIGAYDWTKDAYSNLRNPTNQKIPTAPEDRTQVVLDNPGLQPLRDSLFQQMARGASQGVVEMTAPGPVTNDLTKGSFPSAQIRIGDAPSSVNQADRSVDGNLGAQGTQCTPSEQLEIAAWGDETAPLLNQIAANRSGLSGEFDKPDPTAIARAVQFQLYLGFGAEARQTLRAFEQDQPESPVWIALSFLMDGEQDPTHHFADQAACDGPAALWAVLAKENLTAGDVINTGALRLSFAALPLHLRRQLGPILIEKLLAKKDLATARALSDAIGRTMGQPTEAMTLANAEMELSEGTAALAEEKAETVLEHPGPNHVEALISLTEARVAQNLPVSPDIAIALEANLSEFAGTDTEPRLIEALILAQAASGNFAAAFVGLSNHPDRQETVWQLLASLAADDVFLTHAVLESDQVLPEISDQTKTAVARRLTGLGLPKPAQKWLESVNAADPLLVAEAALKASDAQTALSALKDVQGDVATSLRLTALEILGHEQQRAEIFESVGKTAEATSAQARAGDWSAVASAADGPWKNLAEKLPETPPKLTENDGLPYGPLARGHDLATAGSDTRAAIGALLETLPSPQPPQSDSLTN